ncbi:hypothetical protein [Iodobacter fluviatilis]|uniref:Uncharacterized protein n=1 Tax=Iodobacter fluviatilis TaxID=537 RepID=A0A377Q3M2_9NEIS|nr:hypothetical protein [Iodobacter fluviatilis]TCU90152.1 hypothetical protein EV682_101172 [Iodobacter fluviatilis]STQ89179.1 Uncharacterised protein [Iodobacter fluviatilis]
MSISSELLDRIYVKTPQGQKEIAERSSGLPARQRRLLILIDGTKSSSELAVLLAEFELSARLEELVGLGFIQLKDTARQEEINAKAAVAPVAAHAAPPVPPSITPLSIDPLLLEQAKKLMVESAQHCLGIMARSLIEEIQQSNESNCKVVIARWNMALRQSSKARTHADQYVDAVKTLIGID